MECEFCAEVYNSEKAFVKHKLKCAKIMIDIQYNIKKDQNKMEELGYKEELKLFKNRYPLLAKRIKKQDEKIQELEKRIKELEDNHD